MYRIRLQKNGRIVDDTGKETTAPLAMLARAVSLEEDWSLRDFFSMLERYPVFIELTPHFPLYLQQYHHCPAQGCTLDVLDGLRISKTIEMIAFPPPPRIEAYTTLAGVTGNETSEIKTYWLESLLDMPLFLGKLKHVVFGDTVKSLEYATVFTLFDVIDGIAWQLSFHNMPASCVLPPTHP